MTYKEFRSAFRSIVYTKGELKSNENCLRRLFYWDKYGSHADAIQRANDRREALNTKFKSQLKGKSYAEWQQISKKLSSYNSTMKAVKSRQIEMEEKINKLIGEL